MKVLHVTPTYVPAWRYGGPIRSVHGLCKALAAQGVAVDVATTTVDGPENLDVPEGKPVELDGVKVRYFDSPMLRRLYWSPGLARFVREHLHEYDLVHLHSIFLWPTGYAARVARKRGVPYLLSPRGMLVDALIRRRNRWLKLAWINLFERRNLRSAAMVHFTSEIEAVDAARVGVEWKAHCVVPNGIDIDIGSPAESARASPIGAFDGRPYVIFLGRVTWKKGLDRLVTAIARFTDARLLIVGNDESGYAETLKVLIAKEGVAERVVLMGAITGAAKDDLIRRASVLVLPSYSENFGNVVLEAMAQGCPVVVTSEVGAAPIVEQSGAGLVVDGEPARLAQAIQRVLGDSALRADMGRRGRDTVASSYSWTSVAARMRVQYDAVQRVRRGAAA